MPHNHFTKDLGDLGVVKVIGDLTDKGWKVFLPISEHLPIDLIAYKVKKSGKMLVKTFQVKYRNGRGVGRRKTEYYREGVDFVAYYFSKVNTVIYVNSEMQDNIICILPNGTKKFYWYEDFTEIPTKKPKKKSYKDFGYTIFRNSNKKRNRHWSWPSKRELKRLVWEMPITDVGKKYNVSDSAVRKVARKRGVVLPPQGYWAMNIRNKNEIRKKCKILRIKYEDINWPPSKKKLSSLLKKYTHMDIAEMAGVSNITVGKYTKKYGIKRT